MFLQFYSGILVVLGNCPVNTNNSIDLYDLLTNFIYVNKLKYVCYTLSITSSSLNVHLVFRVTPPQICTSLFLCHMHLS